MMLIAALVIAVAALGIGSFIAHRREKGTRPPHAHDRSMWIGT